jgi:hypothetical protein
VQRVQLSGDLYHPVVPAGAVRITRPTRWANPYPVERYGRAESMRLYRGWLAGDAAAVAEARGIGCRLRLYGPQLVEAARRELTGRDLACWCSLDQDCHGDLLIAAIQAQA